MIRIHEIVYGGMVAAFALSVTLATAQADTIKLGASVQLSVLLQIQAGIIATPITSLSMRSTARVALPLMGKNTSSSSSCSTTNRTST